MYNCGSGKKISVYDLVNIIDLSKKDLKIKNDLTKPTIKTSLYLDCKLAKKELGWTPNTTLEDGIKKLFHGGLTILIQPL